jgi:8-amino-7-oxononanoate synthase
MMAAVAENARHLAEALGQLGYQVLAGAPVRMGPSHDAAVAQVTTPIIPILVGDDWKAALLWRALYDRGVFTNCALHPAVPPGGALLRTSVMATHDRATLDSAIAMFGEVKEEFESEHGALGAAPA